MHMNCMSQHVSGNILYMLPLSFFVGLNERNATHFYDDAFERIFTGVTGINPRRTLVHAAENTPVWGAVRAAQKGYFHALHRAHADTQGAASAATRTFTHTLDARWLAAMLGDREYVPDKKPSGYCAGMDIGTCAPGDYVATRKPTRGDDTVDESKRQLAMAALSEALSTDHGVPLRACDAPHESLRHASVRVRDGAYEVRVGHAFVNWDVARHVASTAPVGAPSADRSDDERVQLEFGASPRTDTSVPADDEAFKSVLARASPTARARLLQWLLAARGETLDIPNITRNQSPVVGLAGRPAPMDVTRVFAPLFLRMLELYPAALRPAAGSAIRYRVVQPLVLEHLRQLVATASVATAGDPQTLHPQHQSVWGHLQDTFQGRQPHAHQTQAIDALVNGYVQNHYARQLLWMEPGAGKTYIVLSFWARLVRDAHEGIAPYLIYTAPKSAHATVAKELAYFGFRVIATDPMQPSPAAKLAPLVRSAQRGSVILVEHDWLKQAALSEALEPIVPDAFILFDEMHKFLNATKRTSFALSVATSCRGFIAFTGTPITASDPLNLKGWLALVLPYDVTSKNIWTSLGAFLRVNVLFDTEVRDTAPLDCTKAMLNDREYTRLIGKLRGMGTSEFTTLLKTSLKHVYVAMAAEILKVVQQPTRVPASHAHSGARRTRRAVMAVVYNVADQTTLLELLTQPGSGLAKNDVLLFGTVNKTKVGRDADSETAYNAAYGIVDFTDDSVEKGGADYRVIIVPQSRDAGYSLSRCEHIFTAPYPSNQATRAQLRNRIRRLDQHAPFVESTAVAGGVLTSMLARQNEARNVAEALRLLRGETNAA